MKSSLLIRRGSVPHQFVACKGALASANRCSPITERVRSAAFKSFVRIDRPVGSQAAEAELNYTTIKVNGQGSLCTFVPRIARQYRAQSSRFGKHQNIGASSRCF